MEGYDYDAAASTVKIEDITSDETNRMILRRLKDNDPTFDKLIVSKTTGYRGRNSYRPDGARDLGWLGYFIGQNTHLKELRYSHFNREHTALLCARKIRGVNCNKSIHNITVTNMDLSGGEVFQSMHPFFENNHNLCEFEIRYCVFGAGCARSISLALRCCNMCLKSVKLDDNLMGDDRLIEIIEALSMHPQLEQLSLQSMHIGRIECTALANLLYRSSAEIHTLILCRNLIDDEGVDDLVEGALANSNLNVLNLSVNPNISARGWQSLAALLGNTNSNLEEMDLSSNNLGDEGVLIFAKALASNRKLKTLNLYNSGITAEGWSRFSKILCNTSSINNTFLSNHTLESVHFTITVRPVGMPDDVEYSLALNMSDNKKEVAMKKILLHHQHFGMHPFFEWDLKVLPLVIKWFERARSIESIHEATRIGKLHLGSIYQFIRAMPEVFEPAQHQGGER